MAVPRKLLSHDEVVVRHMHTHPKVLLWRIALEIILLAAAVTGTVLAPDSWNPWGLGAIWVLFLVVSVPLFLLPWLRWACTSYTVTTKRVITRAGIINKTGHDLPLTRISDVQQERTITDRIFGAGTLSLQTSADDPLLLVDVPQVQTVQLEISNLLFHDVPSNSEAGSTD